MSRFAWRDLLSVDPERSSAFFAALLEWTELPFETERGGYRQFLRGDEPIGGVLALDPAIGHPSHWISYVDVANLDAVVAKTARLGGAIASEPSEIPGVGRFAALADKQGALICALQWHANAIRPPERSATPAPGTVAWNELLTADPSSAAAFYSKLFNWEQRRSGQARGDERLLLRGGEPEAGIVRRLPGMAMSAWLVHFATADLDASLARVEKLGGRVVSEITEDGRGGRFAYAADPTEAGFGLMQSDAADA
jgi:predicted enzyme related to lactoylglutathione lyase